jgi:hypothetical protein
MGVKRGWLRLARIYGIALGADKGTQISQQRVK